MGGRPLTISGEYEFALDYLRRRTLGADVEQPHRSLLEQELEVEAFYSFGPALALFAQARVAMEEDLLSHGQEDVSDVFVERGEMWLYTENIAGTHFYFDVGRLDFEDDRRWWWDQELDAVRTGYETETTEIVVALARELAPERSDQSRVDPEHERLLRLLGEASWDWHPDHGVELFVLHQRDHSPTERPGRIVRDEREDESDARLTWVGARAMGALELRSGGILGYWLDAALVRGEERLLEFEELSPGRSVVDALTRRDVSGWALDTGASWILPLAGEPRLFAGVAIGSGDDRPETGTDRAFRQSGLHANEAGFGGVERFASYGIVLDPELSNLRILTLGAGLSLLRSSSLDLVYHDYRLLEPAESLRDARLEAELDGVHRYLGYGIDLVLALEEWERLEFEFVASAFRAGRAFVEDGTWSYGGAFAVRYAF